MHKPEYKKGDKILVEAEILTDRNESYTYLTSIWGNDNERIYLADFDIFMKKPEVMLCLTEKQYELLMECMHIALDEYRGLDEGVEIEKLEVELIKQHDKQNNEEV